MRPSTVFPLLLIPMLAIPIAFAQPIRYDNPPPPFAPDRILVKFQPGTAASDIGAIHGQAEGQALKVIPGIGVHVIQVPAGTVQRKIALYQSNPNVVFAEPDFNRVLIIPDEGQDPPGGSGLDYFAEQWGFNNTGQILADPATGGPGYFGTVDADIDAPEGWDMTTGSASVVIAVLDTGLDVDADCANAIDPVFPNLEFVGKCVDAQNFVSAYSGTTDDLVQHGTHVAGIAAAHTNNGIGVAGVGWSSSIANLKACYEYEYDALPPLGIHMTVGVCPVSASAEAMIYAADQGYHVINMSYASDEINANGVPIGLAGPTQTEADAVDYAWGKGLVLVAAAGNDGNTTPVYPAAYGNVIAVGATDPDDNRADFSTYGNWVSLMAPGVNILSTVPNNICVFYSDILGIPFDPSADVCLNWFSGTSMASPHVAGAAALVWGQLVAGQSPDGCQDGNGVPCNAVVRSRIENGADVVGASGANLLNWSQHGRLNLAGALTAPADPGPGNSVPSAAFTYSCSALICSFDGSGSTDSDGDETIINHVWNFGDGTGANSMTADHTYASQGNYTVTLTVTDNQGANGVASASFRAKNRGSTAGSAGGDGDGTTTIEAEKGRKKCSDGIDNDGDGLSDAADPDCQ